MRQTPRNGVQRVVIREGKSARSCAYVVRVGRKILGTPYIHAWGHFLHTYDFLDSQIVCKILGFNKTK